MTSLSVPDTTATTRTASNRIALTMTATISNEASRNLFLDDGQGHINPELAMRIYNWKQKQRIDLNLPEFRHSTRQGLRWVGEMVQELTQDESKYEDLIQEGVIALMQAMTNYEHDAPPQQSFEDFAKGKIRQALEDFVLPTSKGTPARKALSMESTVEITDPLETHYSNQDEWEVREGLVLDNGQGVDPEKLVDEFLDETLQYEGEDQMWVHQQQVAVPLRDSIPDAAAVSNVFSFDDEVSPDDAALTDMIRYNVDEFLGATLDDLESQIIQMRFGLEEGELPKTQREVAFELDISISKVRKLQKSSLEKLRKAYTNRYVEDADDDHYWEDTV